MRGSIGEEAGSSLLGLISWFGEEVCAEPDHLESKLREMASGLADILELGSVGLLVEISEKRRVTVGGRSHEGSEKFPMMRGKVRVGEIFVGTEEPLTEEQANGLRAAAASCALAVDAAHAREVSPLSGPRMGALCSSPPRRWEPYWTRSNCIRPCSF